MITDTVSNAHLYRGLSRRLAVAFNYLRRVDLQQIALGTHEIDGKLIYAIVQEYDAVPVAQGSWEAHRQYIDLQYVVSGSERIGFARLSRMQPGVYDPVRDVLSCSGEGDFLTLGPGDFMLLFPEEAHMPRIAVKSPERIRKVVVKVAVADDEDRRIESREQ